MGDGRVHHIFDRVTPEIDSKTESAELVIMKITTFVRYLDGAIIREGIPLFCCNYSGWYFLFSPMNSTHFILLLTHWFHIQSLAKPR